MHAGISRLVIPRDLYSRREKGECEIAWKTGKPVEPSGKNANVQERFLATPLMTIRG